MKLRTVVISFLLTVIQYAATAQNISVTTSADRQEILIGEPISLTIRATIPNNKATAWITIDTIPHFEILSKTKIDSTLSGNTIQLEQTYTVTSWDSGRWQLPSFHLPATAAKTKPITVNVTFTPFDATKDYNDVKDIMEATGPGRTTWYWYLVGIVMLIGLLLLLFYPQKKKPANVAADEGAYKEALRQLEALKKETTTTTDAKSYYTTLIHIFRNYLQKRKGIHSFSKTTDDIAQQIKSLRMPATPYNTLVQTLQLSDFVKFARFQPSANENSAALEDIKKSIITIENLE